MDGDMAALLAMVDQSSVTADPSRGVSVCAGEAGDASNGVVVDSAGPPYVPSTCKVIQVGIASMY
jgi:hypothetical protein